MQILYNPAADLFSNENMLFAVTMGKIYGSGTKLFIVEYENFNIIDIIEVPNVITGHGESVRVVQLSQFNGNLLQVSANWHNGVKLITFDKQPEIVGEFEIMGQLENGNFILREML